MICRTIRALAGLAEDAFEAWVHLFNSDAAADELWDWRGAEWLARKEAEEDVWDIETPEEFAAHVDAYNARITSPASVPTPAAEENPEPPFIPPNVEAPGHQPSTTKPYIEVDGHAVAWTIHNLPRGTPGPAALPAAPNLSAEDLFAAARAARHRSRDDDTPLWCQQRWAARAERFEKAAIAMEDGVS